MARLTGPLLSLGAKGEFGGSVIYDRYAGQDIARSKVAARNPNTPAQAESRGAFATLSWLWQLADTRIRPFWGAYVSDFDMPARAAFIKASLARVRGEPDMDGFRAVVGVSGGLQPLGMTVVPQSRQLSVKLVTPYPPPDWTFRRPTACAFPDQPAGAGRPAYLRTGQRLLHFLTVNLLDLEPVPHQVRGWYEITTTDGRTLWSRELRATETPLP